jgi:hypothetical protein
MMRAIEICRSHDEKMPVQRVEVFLLVCMRGRLTREQAAEDLGISTGGAYRNLMALCSGEYYTNTGQRAAIGWLEVGPDDIESRRLSWTLSAKGRRVKEQMERVLK